MILLKSFLLGLSVAAPVGPIGLLCMQRTLQYGRRAGFLSGLGAASADSIYAIFAAFGFTVITKFLTEKSEWIQGVGAIFLLYLGVRLLFKKASSKVATSTEGHKFYLSTLFLTITNPITILSFVAMFAGLGIESSSILSSFLLVIGVFSGSALWWFILSFGVSLAKAKFTPKRMRIVNIFSGVLLIVLGVSSFLYK